MRAGSHMPKSRMAARGMSCASTADTQMRTLPYETYREDKKRPLHPRRAGAFDVLHNDEWYEIFGSAAQSTRQTRFLIDYRRYIVYEPEKRPSAAELLDHP
ncbi:uncharacterized protein BBA_04893 [Beauveria bassiana ARSEF 2860]|uniref:Uncharacterized protein n=1 Tax=Beauveria bassiana (strain ARSEF 2860) TaxID=655819 RepID=J4W839_BEAB2|nr:uncharacterized protein BBA_04893 [Beauveria bassiana ARSEF 2860]EJP66400.1 hypothetical protein BBA_04893 [Beauveria bassiana ARSEF 2860]